MGSEKLSPGALSGATGAAREFVKATTADETENSTTVAQKKERGKTKQARWREHNPLADWAHCATRSAIRRGLIAKQPCAVCGSPDAEAHHTQGAQGHARDERGRRMTAREEDDAVVCSLGADLRVICCRNGMQWIVQRRRGAGWRSVGFCATRRGLMRVLDSLGAPVEAVAHLPEHIRRRA